MHALPCMAFCAAVVAVFVRPSAADHSLLALTTNISTFVVSPAPSDYGRGLQLANGSFLACAQHAATDGRLRIALYSSTDAMSWTYVSAVREIPNDGASQLTNCHLLATASHVACAYRHHSNCSGVSCETYRIEISTASLSLLDWQLAGAVEAGTTPVWEPFLFQHPNGSISCAYSRELSPGPGGKREQDIVWRLSEKSAPWLSRWGPALTVAHNHGSRNGMPGIATLRDGSYLCVYEGFLDAWGHFSVCGSVSTDQGNTWSDRVEIHSSGTGHNSGSPQVAVTPEGVPVVVFMSNEDYSNPRPWPANAAAKVVTANSTSLPLSFGLAATVTPMDSFWPGFIASKDAVRIIVQRPAGNDDSSAQAVFVTSPIPL